MSNLTDQEALEMREIYNTMQDTYAKLFIAAYLAVDGNMSKIAIGLHLSRGTVHKYVKKTYGANYRKKILASVGVCYYDGRK